MITKNFEHHVFFHVFPGVVRWTTSNGQTDSDDFGTETSRFETPEDVVAATMERVDASTCEVRDERPRHHAMRAALGRE